MTEGMTKPECGMRDPLTPTPYSYTQISEDLSTGNHPEREQHDAHTVTSVWLSNPLSTGQ
jgi:hypothetical protein